MIERFGKESAGYLKAKASFYDLDFNEVLKRRRGEAEAIYVKQPRREHCKNCCGPISGASFAFMGVDYVTCPRCGHVNGAHEDNSTYCDAVYMDSDHMTEVYHDADRATYIRRADDIYAPKIEFMKEVLLAQGQQPAKLRFADLGAGSGHLVTAMLRCGLENVCGFEVAQAQVEQANAINQREVLKRIGLDQIVATAAAVEADVVTSVFSLEHFREPREVMRGLAANPAVRYLFLAVPMFSPTTVIECAFPDVMPRQLGPGHTHLYTRSSLAWLFQEFGYRPIAEWWFGADAVDVLRCVAMTLLQEQKSSALVDEWSRMMEPLVDELQSAIDRQKLSSEVHVMLTLDR